MSAVRHHDANTDSIEAIAHPARLAIVDMIVDAGGKGISSGEIARSLDLSPATTSHHLGWLSDAGLIVPSRNGRRMIYRAEQQTISALLRSLELKLSEDGSICSPTWRQRTAPDARTVWLDVSHDRTAAMKLVWTSLRHVGCWRRTATHPYDRVAPHLGGVDRVSIKPVTSPPANDHDGSDVPSARSPTKASCSKAAGVTNSGPSASTGKEGSTSAPTRLT